MSPRLRILLLGIVLPMASGSCSRALDRWTLTTGPNLPAAKSRPRITGIEDLGTLVVPDRGKVPHVVGDGLVVPGETILIRGTGFGRLPTVLVGGRPTSVLGRTEDGGILVRIPKGVEAPCRVLVTTTKGSATEKIAFRRYLLAKLPEGGLTLYDTTSQTPKALPGPTMTGIRAMVLHRFGSVAYLLDGSGNLTALDLASARGPKIAGTFGNEAPELLASAPEADLLASVGKGKVTLWDTSHPTRPSRWKTYDLPKAGMAVADAALSPDGKTLAVATAQGLLLADVTDPMGLRWAGKNPKLVTKLRIRQIRILHENPKAADHRQTLWVLAGDDRSTAALDNHGIEILSGRLHTAANGEDLPAVQKLRKSRQAGPWTPTTWAITFSTTEVASGTALRQDPARMLLYLPAMPTELLRIPRPYDSPAAQQALAALVGGQTGMLSALNQAGRLFVLDGSETVRKELPSPLLFAVTTSTSGRLVWGLGCNLKPTGRKKVLGLACGLLVTDEQGKTRQWYPARKTRPATDLDVMPRQRLLVQP